MLTVLFIAVLTFFKLTTATPCVYSATNRSEIFADFLTWHYGTSDDPNAYLCHVIGENCNTIFQKAEAIYKSDQVIFLPLPISLSCYSSDFVILRPLDDDDEEISSMLVKFRSNLEFFKISNTDDGLLDLVTLINGLCWKFRNTDGSLNNMGQRRQQLLSNVYINEQRENCQVMDWDENMSQQDFNNMFLFQSKPVIFRHFAKSWPAMQRWTDLKFFSQGKLANKTVPVQLFPNNKFESIEPRQWWVDKPLPKADLRNGVVPDRILVLPTDFHMTFKQLVGVIESISSGKLKNATAYLQYCDIKENFLNLDSDLPFPSKLTHLIKESANIWLSDGNTVGKLHYDAGENFLVQLVGKKSLTIFHPHNNTNLYEGLLQLAEYDAEIDIDENGHISKPWNFTRNGLKGKKHYGHVFSPVELASVDYLRFPRFRKAKSLQCTIEPGDALYMPAYWWHEVKSSPDIDKKFNLAVNFWFSSFFNKKIGQYHKFDINPKYKALLSEKP